MKTFSFYWITSLITIVFFQFSQGSSNKNITARDIEAYKLQYAVSCGPGAGISTAAMPFYQNTFNGFNYNYAFLDTTTYNTLFIPDTLSGTDFTLRIHDSSKQYLNGPATTTASYNTNAILGPTLIFNKGTAVQMHVINQLHDSTTLHWHGIHLPAIMDGGPHQVIAPGAEWDPTWIVKNNAATYWYHPHLHMKTSQQLIQGLGGLIIVRDDAERVLALPRRYGVDDIPLILNDKRFETVTNQFVQSRYGDTMMCNGTLNAQYNVPAQVVRFRLLNAAPDRAYNVGFSDNRSFYVIGGDAGLLNNPVAVTRYIMSPGERIEILVNFSGQLSQTVRVRAFNSELPSDISGSDPDNATTADFVRNKLGARDFDILRLDVTAATTTPITVIPTALISNDNIDSTQATVTRTIKITQAGTACPDPTTKCAWFNKQMFDMNRIDYKVKQDAVEIWEITNNALTSHPFHIHDVSFKILSKSGGPIPDYEKGWKDVILVRKGETVRFIAKFSDYADSTHPYMYHCHVSFHEDEGMMGQFVVTPPAATLPAISISNAKMKEGNTGTSQMKFTVSLNSPATQAVTVNYTTKNVTATAGSDYIAANGTVPFAAGESTKTIAITINGDTNVEANETFKVMLSNAVNATIAQATGKGTIQNDDVSAALAAMNNAVTLDRTSASVKIFPNPVTNGQLHISINPLYKSSLQLYLCDASGNVLQTQKLPVNSNTVTINVAGLSGGIYFLSFSNGKEWVYKQNVEILNGK